MQRRMVTIGVVAGVLALMVGGLCVAQPAPAAKPRQPTEDDGAGNFDPAQMRQRMMERMKEQLGADDEAWKVIEPRLTKVMELNRGRRWPAAAACSAAWAACEAATAAGDQGGDRLAAATGPGSPAKRTGSRRLWRRPAET